MTAPITPAELDALESLHAKATQECVCRWACECGSLEAERKLESLLPDAFPRLAAAARQGITLAAKLAEAKRLLRRYVAPDVQAVAAFLAQQTTPTAATPQEK